MFLFFFFLHIFLLSFIEIVKLGLENLYQDKFIFVFLIIISDIFSDFHFSS